MEPLCIEEIWMEKGGMTTEEERMSERREEKRGRRLTSSEVQEGGVPAEEGRVGELEGCSAD